MEGYWECNNCGAIKLKEEEVYCWKCGIEQMIYKEDKDNRFCEENCGLEEHGKGYCRACED